MSRSMYKQMQRLVKGLCCGCGKNPCECKHKGNEGKRHRKERPALTNERLQENIVS